MGDALGESSFQIERLLSDARRAEERLRTLPAVQEAKLAARGVAKNRARTVSVTVDIAGSIHDLTIFDSALNVGGPRLAFELVALIRDAQLDAIQRAGFAAEEILADDPEMLASAIHALHQES